MKSDSSAHTLRPALPRMLRRHGLPLLLLTVLPCLWWQPLLSGKYPDFMDTVTLLTPMRMEAARQIREGVPPLWNPHVFSGIPLAANPQPSIWYPPQYLFYLAPGPLSNGVVTLLHYILGGIGMYLLVRRLTRDGVAGLYAGFVFQFGSAMVSRIALSMHLYTLAWMPWLLMAVEASLREKGRWPGAATVAVGAILAMHFLAGAPQMTYYTVLVLPAYWLIRAWQLGGKSGMPRAILRGAAAAFFFFLFSGIQLVPTMDFLGRVERGAVSIENLRHQGLNPPNTWRAFIGGTGTEIEDTDTINAIGLGALLLVPLAFVRRRRWGVSAAFFAIGLLGFLLSLGILVPLWSNLLPYYAGFHAPRRALLLWSFAGVVLAGIGAHHLLIWLRARKAPRSVGWVSLAILAIPTVVFLPRLDRHFAQPERFEPDPRYIAEMDTARFLVVDPTLAYSYDSRRFDYGRSMMPNLASWFGYYDAQGYDPLVPIRYGMMRRFVSQRSGVFYPSHGAYMTAPEHPLLRFLNVQYLVGRYDLFNPGRVIPGAFVDISSLEDSIETVIPDTRWPLYRYTEDRPFAWFTGRTVVVDSPEEAMAAAAHFGTFDTASVEQPLLLPPLPQRPEVHGHYTNGRTIELHFDPPPAAVALLVVSVAWDPGWRAQSDGKTLHLLPANGFLIGAIVPAGTESILLRYAPPSFLRGLGLTLGGILLGGALVLLQRRAGATTQ